MAQDDLPVLAFGSTADWHDWLTAHGTDASGVWLKFAKKGAPEQTVTFDEALDVALCFGWIDGQIARFDAEYWLKRFTPRKPRSKWSQINTDKAEALIAAGRMQPAGQLEVDAAKADGRWQQAYASQRTATVPDDLRAALDANAAAREYFGTISSINRFAILYRIHNVKRPETRARKIAQYVQMLAEHKTIH